MKGFHKFLISLLLICCFTSSKAQGWPENYEGVMLQGFYWDSYSDTKWTNLEKQADELSKYFDLIWIPNSGNCGGGKNMGYMPQYWFTNHNSSFGSEAELRRMIKTFADKGTGIIEDVVVNHRNGVSNWTDFPVEEWDNQTWKIGPEGICRDDEVAGASGQAKPTGNYDTGDNFDGCRDLDHTNANVQNNVKNYCRFLLEDLGYAGFRYDMVKGYAPKYTQIYNEYSKPTYSVGEYWDSSYDNVANWIEGTGKTSAAFDFPCKYQINNALNNGENLKDLVWYAQYTTPQPAGMIHYGYPQYSVTFVDNHDTYRDNSKFTGNVLEANAFILCSPGTPCVFLPHYKEYPNQIQALINARKAVGVNNCSEVTVRKTDFNIYMAEVVGTKGKLIVKLGSEWGSYPDPSEGYGDPYTFGDNYCVWIKLGDTSVTVPPAESDLITVYYDNTNTKFNPVYCYTFANNANNTQYSWPGQPMIQVDGNIYKVNIPEGSNAVFNSGNNKPQTVDVMSVKDGYVYTGLNSTDAAGNYLVDKGEIYIEDPDSDNNPDNNEGVVTPDPGETVDPTPDPGEVVDPVPDPGETVDPTPDPGEVVDPTPDPGEPVDPVPAPGEPGDPTTDPGETIEPTPDPGEPADPTPDPGETVDPVPTPGEPGDPTPDPGEPANPTPDPGEIIDPAPAPGEPEIPETGEGDNTGTDQNPDNSDVEENPGSDDNNPDLEGGVEGIIWDDEEPIYFNLQGFPVKNPSNGLYIKIEGNKRQKIFIK